MAKDFLPKKSEIRKNYSSWFGARIHDKNLWQYNINTVPRAIAIGLFIAFIPLPMQMLLAVISAIALRANVPVAIACTWITNPFTFIPINYFIHDFGEWILNVQHQEMEIHPLGFDNWNNSIAIILEWLEVLGTPFLVALPIVALCVSFLGYVISTTVWLIVHKFRTSDAKKRG